MKIINKSSSIVKRGIVRLGVSILFCGCIFFISSGKINYNQAWIFFGTMFIPMTIVFIYFLKKDPELLERRMKGEEKQSEQKSFAFLSVIIFVALFVIPGLDIRFGWSKMPLWISIVGDVIWLLGYFLFFLVLKENTFASRIIEINKGQKVVSTGPYSLVRHPMYSAALIMFSIVPLALGSWWALICVIPLPFLFIYRLLNEEKFLIKELLGYKEYTQKVNYRLIPFIW